MKPTIQDLAPPAGFNMQKAEPDLVEKVRNLEAEVTRLQTALYQTIKQVGVYQYGAAIRLEMIKEVLATHETGLDELLVAQMWAQVEGTPLHALAAKVGKE